MRLDLIAWEVIDAFCGYALHRIGVYSISLCSPTLGQGPRIERITDMYQTARLPPLVLTPKRVTSVI